MAALLTNSHPSAGRSRALRVGGASLTILLATAAAPASAALGAPSHNAHAPVKTAGVHLSGAWAGSYSGSYQGTFKVTWNQHGQKLSGSIVISAFGDTPTSLSGSLKGSSITFGTVGSKSITYSGKVSGSSMSGTWKIEAHDESLGGGAWKATKL
jgi:hypothetical protein